MIRIYLDWNIISKLKTPEFADIKAFLTENRDKFSIPFSQAHCADISKSDTPGNEKLHEDIANMDIFCCDNYMAYDNEYNTVAPYIVTPSEYYDMYKNNHLTLDNVTDPSFLSSLLAEIDHPIAASMMNHVLDQPIHFPKWDDSITSNPAYSIFAKLQNVSTFRELIDEVMSIMHRITTDKETYKALRSGIDPKLLSQIQVPSSSVVPALDLILMKAGLPMGFMDTVQSIIDKTQNNGNNMSQFTAAYILLDMLYRPDKLPKKGNNAINILTDAMHTYYGAFCDYFVTDDKKLADKARVLFHEFNINTPIITSKELISTLSPLVWNNHQDTVESIIVDIINATRIDKRDTVYEIYKDEMSISWTVKLDKYYFNFFNYANVCIELDGQITIHLYRHFSGLSQYVSYREVEQLLNVLSNIFGEIPQKQKTAIKYCEENASFIWSSMDNSISVLIREDSNYRGQPELILTI